MSLPDSRLYGLSSPQAALQPVVPLGCVMLEGRGRGIKRNKVAGNVRFDEVDPEDVRRTF